MQLSAHGQLTSTIVNLGILVLQSQRMVFSLLPLYMKPHERFLRLQRQLRETGDTSVGI